MPTENLTVTVNGETREAPAGLNVAGLLEYLKISGARVAVERNLEILPRAQWANTPVQTGDRFEIVHLVGGG